MHPVAPKALRSQRPTLYGLCLLPYPSRRIWQGSRQHGRHDLTGSNGDVMLAWGKGHERSLGRRRGCLGEGAFVDQICVYDEQ